MLDRDGELNETERHMSCAGVVPVPPAGGGGDLVIPEAVLEVVEDGELVARQHVAVGLGLDLGPQLGEGGLEDAGYGGVPGAVWALARDLESLCHRRVLGLLTVVMLMLGRLVLGRGAGHGEVGEVWHLVRRWVRESG